MCFRNNLKILEKYRGRKRPIRVWKTGLIDPSTGLVVTNWCGCAPTDVVWKQGTIVKPDRIRKPLKDGINCTSGLYFHITSPHDYPIHNDKTMATRSDPSRGLVIATVNPEDVIAVDEFTLCAIRAKIIKAPNPDQRLKRLEVLNRQLRTAKEKMASRKELLKIWESEEEDTQEAFALIVDEIRTLKAKK